MAAGCNAVSDLWPYDEEKRECVLGYLADALKHCSGEDVIAVPDQRGNLRVEFRDPLNSTHWHRWVISASKE